ncbi:hypothetical protein [Glycomyces terrestris]|uniref:Uncharacterized protein n=1 Tax=Glycomyces terrestris TaxID=2493553 RepID=A0A426UU53_9ACTN|nr:hypothetical protein [Glycomyces terrestris]RRR97376.1 hypothetical protein EIW28_18380 [Glycomyces terrestris]
MRARGLETAVRAGGAVVAAAAAVLAALIESFLVPTYWDGVAIPLAGALAFAGNWSLAALAVWWTGSRWGALLTSIAWFGVVLAASMPTSAGSLVVGSGLNGYALLLAGTAGIAVALWRYFRPRPQQAPSAPKESRQ